MSKWWSLTLFVFLGNLSLRGQSDFVIVESQDTQLILAVRPNVHPPDTLYVNNTPHALSWDEGRTKINIPLDHRGQLIFLRSHRNDAKELFHLSANALGNVRLQRIPLWTSILPPLLAVLLALWVKEVVFSLFMGVLMGSFLINGLRFDGILHATRFIFETISVYAIEALNDTGHLSVIVFSILIGGMVSLITKNGGMMGVLDKVAGYAISRQRVQMLTYILGIAIFFDDYANTLIVGNTMRSLTDKFRISREKLAYLVDSTAAPVASIAFITTWIGAELGFIGTGLDQLSHYPFLNSPYSLFLASLKYSFYPFFTLIFIYLLIKTGRDFGPMGKAEYRALHTGGVQSEQQQRKDEPNMEDLSPVEGAQRNWHHAFWPVVTTIVVTILGLIITGMENAHSELSQQMVLSEDWSVIWGHLHLLSGGDGFFLRCGTLLGLSDSYQALLWASFSGLVVALFLSIYGGVMTLWDASHWTVQGFKTMIPAIVILILAWSLANTTEKLGTADFIIQLFGSGFEPSFLPILIFIMAFSISFATGSSWSTMAILYPLAIPLAWKVSLQAGWSPEEAQDILLNCIATVLAASVLGDHCSPISDTTILSSLASDCNHLDHVKTQLPYAATVGGMSLVSVAVSAFIGGSWWMTFILLTLGTVVFYFFLQKFGKNAEKVTS